MRLRRGFGGVAWRKQAQAEFRVVEGALVEKSERWIAVLHFVAAALHILGVVFRLGHERAPLQADANAELLGRSLVVGIGEAVADASTVGHVTDEGDAPALGGVDGGNDAGASRESGDGGLNTGFEPVEPGRVLVEECKKNGGQGAESDKVPLARAKQAKNAQAKDGINQS